jgi:hypothetical protein
MKVLNINHGRRHIGMVNVTIDRIYGDTGLENDLVGLSLQVNSYFLTI